MTSAGKIEKFGTLHFSLRFSQVSFIFVCRYTLQFLGGSSKLRHLLCTLRDFLAKFETATLAEAQVCDLILYCSLHLDLFLTCLYVCLTRVEMLGAIRVQYKQLRVPGHWKECRGASRVAGEEARSHLSGFLSPGHLEELFTRGGGEGEIEVPHVGGGRSPTRVTSPLTPFSL